MTSQELLVCPNIQSHRCLTKADIDHLYIYNGSCISCWGGVPDNKLVKLFAIQKRCVKLLFGKELHASIKEKVLWRPEKISPGTTHRRRKMLKVLHVLKA